MNLTLAVVNGPNLNRLGKRDLKVYGSKNWDSIWEKLEQWAADKKVSLTYFQSNSEGALIDFLQRCGGEVGGIVFNPGAYAHTSIALRDCVADLDCPVVEIHLSNIHGREPFRRHSYIADVAGASIVGFGSEGYLLGLELLRYLEPRYETSNFKHQTSK